MFQYMDMQCGFELTTSNYRHFWRFQGGKFREIEDDPSHNQKTQVIPPLVPHSSHPSNWNIVKAYKLDRYILFIHWHIHVWFIQHPTSSSTNLNQRLLCCGFIRYQTTLFAVTLASRLRCIFVKPKTSPTFDKSIHPLKKPHLLFIQKDYSEMTQVICTFELEHELPFPTFRWFQPTIHPNHHPNHQPPCHPSIHGGDFRRAVKSLARQGRLEESELRRSAFVGRTWESWESVGDRSVKSWEDREPGLFRFWAGFVFFFRRKSLWGGWMSKVFLEVGWLILSCWRGWLKRLADRWFS